MSIDSTVTPLLAELVGENRSALNAMFRLVTVFFRAIDRREDRRSSVHGYTDRESASHDGLILQTDLGAVQDPLRGQGFPFGPGKYSSNASQH